MLEEINKKLTLIVLDPLRLQNPSKEMSLSIQFDLKINERF